MYKRPSYLMLAVANLLAAVRVPPGMLKPDPLKQPITARFYRENIVAAVAKRHRKALKLNCLPLQPAAL